MSSATVKNMDLDNLNEWRKQRMQALAEKFGGHTALGRKLGYRDGAFVGQMIGGYRPVTEKTIAAAEALFGCDGWFTPQAAEKQQGQGQTTHHWRMVADAVAVELKGQRVDAVAFLALVDLLAEAIPASAPANEVTNTARRHLRLVA